MSQATIPVAADVEIRAWLFRIARNLAIDHHRERLRHPEPSVLLDEGVRRPSQDVDLAVNEAAGRVWQISTATYSSCGKWWALATKRSPRACGLTPDAGPISRIHRARLQLREALASPISTRRTTSMRQSGRQP